MQQIAWLAFGAIYIAFDQGRAPDAPWLALLARTFVWAGTGLCVSSLLLLGYRRASLPWDAAFGRSMALAVVGATLGGALWLGVFNTANGLLQTEPGWESIASWDAEQRYVEWMDCTLMLLVWHGLHHAVVQTQRRHATREHGLALERAHAEAQLVALRAQLDPHFVFNALNAAMELVHEAPPRAVEMLQRLAALLRSAMLQRAEPVELGEELGLLRAYVHIEEVRFEERLRVSWAVQEAALTTEVPPGLLLPLLDNAFKHGTRMPMLIIEIGGVVEPNAIRLWVRNNGTLDRPPHPTSEGVGVTNTRRRLQLAYGPSATLELTEDPPNVCATVTLPRRSAAP